MKKSILDIIEETTDEAMPKEKKKKCEHCDADANESGFCGKCEVDERASQVEESVEDKESLEHLLEIAQGVHARNNPEEVASFVKNRGSSVEDYILMLHHKLDDIYKPQIGEPCENCGNGPVTRDGLCKDC